MAVRGVYTEEENKIIADWKKDAEKEAVWAIDEYTPECFYPVINRVATKEKIKNYASSIGDHNPLWSDEHYAGNTRWGEIIAPPLFPYVICATGRIETLKVPSGLGVSKKTSTGARWEFFRPIRVGDSFRVREGVYQSIEDVTDLDGKGPRSFLVTDGRKYINQDDEVVCILYRRELSVILAPGENPYSKAKVDEYKYTKEELEFIDRMYDGEEIRGADTRYWEDVNVGDDIRPAINGPVTVWDQALEIAGRGEFTVNTRDVAKKAPHLVRLDRNTGVAHKLIEHHLAPEHGMIPAIGRDMEEQALCRVVTNWMGDDGFLKAYGSMHFSDIQMGDTFFSRGKVVNKRVENGEHLVDLVIWEESIRGYIARRGTATVSLFSRHDD